MCVKLAGNIIQRHLGLLGEEPSHKWQQALGEMYPSSLEGHSAGSVMR